MFTKNITFSCAPNRIICAIRDTLLNNKSFLNRSAHNLKTDSGPSKQCGKKICKKTTGINKKQDKQQRNIHLQTQGEHLHPARSLHKWNVKDKCEQKVLGRVTEPSCSQNSRHSFRHYLLPWGRCSHVFGPTLSAQPHRHIVTSPTGVKLPKRVRSRDTKKQTALRRGDHVVAGYAVAEKMNLTDIKKALIDLNLYNISPVITGNSDEILQEDYKVASLPEDLEDIIHVKNRYATDKDRLVKDIFFFQEGSIVFWNVSEKEIMDVLKLATDHCVEVYDMDRIMTESDSLEVEYSSKPTDLIKDTIIMYEHESEEKENPILEKYAFSNALSQSVKLGVWERTLTSISNECEPITTDLKFGKKIQIDNNSVMRLQGEVYGLRHKINMNSDLLDSPDFYWDRGELEDLYKKTCKYLNITKRTRVMNEKLNYCREILELAKDIENTNTSLGIERGILLLILVEIILELWKSSPPIGPLFKSSDEDCDSGDKDN